jgi:hypothetical protein
VLTERVRQPHVQFERAALFSRAPAPRPRPSTARIAVPPSRLPAKRISGITTSGAENAFHAVTRKVGSMSLPHTATQKSGSVSLFHIVTQKSASSRLMLGLVGVIKHTEVP